MMEPSLSAAERRPFQPKLGANSLKSSFVFSRFVDSIVDGSFVPSFLNLR
jgi:hypothetical protein